MDLVELQDVMRRLARVRPIFHSEADFQHAAAWELHLRYPDASIRLERQVLPGLHLDLSMTVAGSTTAIELKYATRLLTLEIDDEPYHLRNHGAQDLRRYDVVKDSELLLEVGPTPVSGTSLIRPSDESGSRVSYRNSLQQAFSGTSSRPSPSGRQSSVAGWLGRCVGCGW